jgi:uroporphyrin-III C-methyltransferase
MYMAVKSAPEIARALIAGGRDPTEPLTFISNATLPSQSVAVTTLGAVDDFLDSTPPPTPAIVVAGHVVAWRDILDWYKGSMRENAVG